MIRTGRAVQIGDAEDVGLAAHWAVVGAAELDDVAGGQGVGVALDWGWGCDCQSGEGEEGNLELHVCAWCLQRLLFEKRGFWK